MSLASLSGIQCYNIGHNGHGIILYGIHMIIMGNLHAEEHSDRGTPSPSTPVHIITMAKYPARNKLIHWQVLYCNVLYFAIS